MASEKLRLKDLVGAAQDRDRIVDHDEPFGSGASRDPVGRVIDGGRSSNEERIVLGDRWSIFETDPMRLHVQLAGRLREFSQRAFVGRCVFGRGIDENREVVSIGFRTPLVAHGAAEMPLRLGDHEIDVALGDLVLRDGTHADQPPTGALTFEGCLQERDAEALIQGTSE